MLLDTEAFTRSFYTEKSLHRRPCYTQKLLHTEAFTHSFYTQKLLHTSCKIAILHKFLPLDLHFARKGCIPSCETAILPHCMPLDLHFARKGCIPSCEIAILPHCMPLDLHFVRKGCIPSCAQNEKWRWKTSKTTFYLGFGHFVEVHGVLCLPRKTSQIRRRFHKTRFWTVSSKFTKYCACHEKWDPKARLILTHANVLATCQKPQAFHVFAQAPDVLHLSRKTTFGNVWGLQMARVPHACHAKWT